MPLGSFRLNGLTKRIVVDSGPTPGQGIEPSSVSSYTYTARGSATVSSTVGTFYPSLVSFGKSEFNPEPFGVAYWTASNWRMRNVRAGGTSSNPTVGAEITLTSMTVNGKADLANWGDNISGNWNGRGVFVADGGSGVRYRSINVTSTSIANGTRTGTLSNKVLLGSTSDANSLYLWQDDTVNSNTYVEVFGQTGDNDNYFTFPADATATANVRLTQHNMTTTVLDDTSAISSVYGADQSSTNKDVLVIYKNGSIQVVNNIFGYTEITNSLAYEGRLINSGVDENNWIGVVGYYDTATYKLDLRPYQPDSGNTSCSLGSIYTIQLPTGASKPYIANESYHGNGQFLVYHTASTIYIHRILMNGLSDLQVSSAQTVSHSNATTTAALGQKDGTYNSLLLLALTGSTLTAYGFTYT